MHAWGGLGAQRQGRAKRCRCVLPYALGSVLCLDTAIARDLAVLRAGQDLEDSVPGDGSCRRDCPIGVTCKCAGSRRRFGSWHLAIDLRGAVHCYKQHHEKMPGGWRRRHRAGCQPGELGNSFLRPGVHQCEKDRARKQTVKLRTRAVTSRRCIGIGSADAIADEHRQMPGHLRRAGPFRVVLTVVALAFRK